MKKWIFLLLLTLAACKGGSGGGNTPPDDDDPIELPSYPFEFDVETSGGMQIELRGHDPELLAEVDLWYSEAQQCVADWYAILYPSKTFEFFDPPPVIIEDNLQTLCDAESGWNALYCTSYIVPFAALTDVSFRFEN